MERGNTRLIPSKGSSQHVERLRPLGAKAGYMGARMEFTVPELPVRTSSVSGRLGQAHSLRDPFSRFVLSAGHTADAGETATRSIWLLLSCRLHGRLLPAPPGPVLPPPHNALDPPASGAHRSPMPSEPVPPLPAPAASFVKQTRAPTDLLGFGV